MKRDKKKQFNGLQVQTSIRAGGSSGFSWEGGSQTDDDDDGSSGISWEGNPQDDNGFGSGGGGITL